jgi:hypothetical protein
LEHKTDEVLLVFGTYRPWPDQGPTEDVFVRYRFGEGTVWAERSSKPRNAYHESIQGAEIQTAWV